MVGIPGVKGDAGEVSQMAVFNVNFLSLTPETRTDADAEESIRLVGHELFHMWSGECSADAPNVPDTEVARSVAAAVCVCAPPLVLVLRRHGCPNRAARLWLHNTNARRFGQLQAGLWHDASLLLASVSLISLLHLCRQLRDRQQLV